MPLKQPFKHFFRGFDSQSFPSIIISSIGKMTTIDPGIIQKYIAGLPTDQQLRQHFQIFQLKPAEVVLTQVLKINEKPRKPTTSQHQSARPVKAEGFGSCQLKIFKWVIASESYFHSLDIEQLVEQQFAGIESTFPKKSGKFLRYEALCLAHEKKKLRKDWGLQELEMFRDLVIQRGTQQDWRLVSFELYCQSNEQYYRPFQQCKEKWINWENPRLIRQPWSRQEEIFVLTEVQLIGKNWAEISRNMGGAKNEHMIKNKFNSLVRQGKKDFPKASSKELIGKILSKLKKQRNQGSQDRQLSEEEPARSRHTNRKSSNRQKRTKVAQEKRIQPMINEQEDQQEQREQQAEQQQGQQEQGDISAAMVDEAAARVEQPSISAGEGKEDSFNIGLQKDELLSNMLTQDKPEPFLNRRNYLPFKKIEEQRKTCDSEYEELDDSDSIGQFQDYYISSFIPLLQDDDEFFAGQQTCTRTNHNLTFCSLPYDQREKSQNENSLRQGAADCSDDPQFITQTGKAAIKPPILQSPWIHLSGTSHYPSEPFFLMPFRPDYEHYLLSPRKQNKARNSTLSSLPYDTGEDKLKGLNREDKSDSISRWGQAGPLSFQGSELDEIVSHEAEDELCLFDSMLGDPKSFFGL